MADLEPADRRWVSAYAMALDTVLARLGSRASGLTGQEAARRRGIAAGTALAGNP